MNKIKALRKEADLREMVEGTTVQWWECVYGIAAKRRATNNVMAVNWVEEGEENRHVKCALTIIENRPVFAGDEVWHKDYGQCTAVRKTSERDYIVVSNRGTRVEFQANIIHALAWHPPKPKTVLVELKRETAEDIAAWSSCGWVHDELRLACRKALEEVK